jgi:hypothetical protein
VISLLDFFFRKLFFEEEKAAEYFIIHAYLRDLVDRRVKVKAAICVPIPSQSTAPPPCTRILWRSRTSVHSMGKDKHASGAAAVKGRTGVAGTRELVMYHFLS